MTARKTRNFRDLLKWQENTRVGLYADLYFTTNTDILPWNELHPTSNLDISQYVNEKSKGVRQHITGEDGLGDNEFPEDDFVDECEQPGLAEEIKQYAKFGTTSNFQSPILSVLEQENTFVPIEKADIDKFTSERFKHFPKFTQHSTNQMKAFADAIHQCCIESSSVPLSPWTMTTTSSLIQIFQQLHAKRREVLKRNEFHDHNDSLTSQNLKSLAARLSQPESEIVRQLNQAIVGTQRDEMSRFVLHMVNTLPLYMLKLLTFDHKKSKTSPSSSSSSNVNATLAVGAICMEELKSDDFKIRVQLYGEAHEDEAITSRSFELARAHNLKLLVVAREVAKHVLRPDKPYFMDVMIEFRAYVRDKFLIENQFPLPSWVLHDEPERGGGMGEFGDVIIASCVRDSVFFPSQSPSPRCNSARYHNINMRTRGDAFRSASMYMPHGPIINILKRDEVQHKIDVPGAITREMILMHICLIRGDFKQADEIFNRQRLFAINEIAWEFTQNPNKKRKSNELTFENEIEAKYLFPIVRKIVNDMFTRERFVKSSRRAFYAQARMMWQRGRLRVAKKKREGGGIRDFVAQFMRVSNGDSPFVELLIGYEDVLSLSENVYGMRRIFKTFKPKNRAQWETQPTFCSTVFSFEGAFHTGVFSQMLRYFGFVVQSQYTISHSRKFVPPATITSSKDVWQWRFDVSLANWDATQPSAISEALELSTARPPIYFNGDVDSSTFIFGVTDHEKVLPDDGLSRKVENRVLYGVSSSHSAGNSSSSLSKRRKK